MNGAKAQGMRRIRDKLATYNESVKLGAGFLNAIGLGLIGFAILRPLVDGTLDRTSLPYPFIIAGLVFHGAAHYVLGYLKKDVIHDA